MKIFDLPNTNMPFVVESRRTISYVPNEVPANFIHNIHRGYYPERSSAAFETEVSEARPILGQRASRYSKSNIPSTESDIWQAPCGEPLHVFVIGPSIYGKQRLIECAADQHLEIPAQNHISLAHKLSGFMLQGVDVEINLWHVADMRQSVGILQEFFHQYRTCFMLVYDVNYYCTFVDAFEWIRSLRLVMSDHVPIVLVGYEDCKEAQKSKSIPVSYTDGMTMKEQFQLNTFYEFSDLTGPAVMEMVFDAAHIALESKVMTSDSKLAESNETSKTWYPCLWPEDV